MAKATLPAGYSGSEHKGPLEIELKQPWLAALLAWLVPGLGHMYQGRTGKGLLFFTCVFGTFLFGFMIGEQRVVYANSRGDDPWRWQYYCQLGVGLPALPALVQKARHDDNKPPILGGFMAPPRSNPTGGFEKWQEVQDSSGNISFQPNELAAWTIHSHPQFELGTVYTVIAGLLNLLVICDAYAGPLVLAPRKRSEPPTTPDEKPAPDANGKKYSAAQPAT